MISDACATRIMSPMPRAAAIARPSAIARRSDFLSPRNARTRVAEKLASWLAVQPRARPSSLPSAVCCPAVQPGQADG